MNEKPKIPTRKACFKAKVLKIQKFIEVRKTVKVQVEKRLYDSKYKRYYVKTYQYLVHYDPNLPGVNKNLSEGDIVKVFHCRRLSPKKSKITQGWG